MKRNEQARMLIGLTIPGRGPNPGPAAAPPATASLARRRWFDGREMLTRAQSWSHRHGLEGEQLACSLALLACGILLGLFVGGFVGFMENATPHGGERWRLTQSATSVPTGQWAEMVKRYRAAPGGHLRSLAESETVSGPQPLGAASSKTAEQSVSAAPGFRDVKKAVVAR